LESGGGEDEEEGGEVGKLRERVEAGEEVGKVV
jgi:hypothetical protein